MTDCEFDWSGDDVDVIVPEQAKIAVYINVNDAIVIRQHGWPEDDQWVYVRRSDAERLARAILEAAGVNDEPMALLPPPNSTGAEPELDLPATKPKDSTAAERSRRYRDRKRDVNRDDRDADRDAP